jgi:SAM-dependent methyltransferase
MSANTAAVQSPIPIRIVACPACESADWLPKGAAPHPGYAICQCQNCHVLFSDPMVAADSAWYSGSWLYGLREAHTGVAGGEYEIPWNFAQALGELQTVPRGSLLDVGCAEGYFLYLAQRAGFEITGLDFNPASLAIARNLLGDSTVHPYSVEELSDRFPGARFDVATMFEVLEHTASPYEALCSIHRLLKPQGKLLLSVPGSRRWPPLFHPEVDAPPHHLTLWTEEALKGLLERCGFRVVAVRAKPLRAEDLGFHLRLALQGIARKLQGHDRGSTWSQPPVQVADPGKRRLEMVRKMAKAGLQPVCWALRVHPRAGGFTLFVHAEKRIT